MYAVCKIACDFKTVTVGKQSIVKNLVKHLCRHFKLNELAEKDVRRRSPLQASKMHCLAAPFLRLGSIDVLNQVRLIHLA